MFEGEEEEMNESVDEDAIVCLECESAMRSYNTFPPPLALLMVVVVVSFPFVTPDPNPDFLTVINRPSTRPPTPRELIAKKPFANSLVELIPTPLPYPPVLAPIPALELDPNERRMSTPRG